MTDDLARKNEIFKSGFLRGQLFALEQMQRGELVPDVDDLRRRIHIRAERMVEQLVQTGPCE